MMKTRFTALLLAAIILANIVVLSGCNRDPQVSTPTGTTTQPTETTIQTTPTETTVPETTVPETTAPPETTVPPTTVPPTTAPPETTAPPATNPPSNGGEMIGSLYTRGELEAMDKTYNSGGYGAGNTSNGVRPGGPVYDQDKYSQYGGNFVGADEKKIYLTFDCGYEYTATDDNGQQYRVTERILDVLKEKNVKAVFFVTMYYCKMNPDLVQRMIDEGHAVGNHTNNHPVMPAQTIDKMVYEVTSLETYVKENFGGYQMTLFRPPTGAFSVQSLSVLKTLGYKTVLWSFQYYDYDTTQQMDHDQALQRVVNSHHNGAIYLLHAVSTTNAAILGDAIDQFRSLGYELDLFQ